jgi:hypothetical protein
MGHNNVFPFFSRVNNHWKTSIPAKKRVFEVSAPLFKSLKACHFQIQTRVIKFKHGQSRLAPRWRRRINIWTENDMYCFVSNRKIEYELFWTITKLVSVGIGTKPTQKIETSMFRIETSMFRFDTRNKYTFLYKLITKIYIVSGFPEFIHFSIYE